MKQVRNIVSNRFVRYLVIGGISYCIEMAALFGLKKGFSLPDVQAVAVSFWVGLVVAFILQKLVVFKNYEKRVRHLTRQMVLYCGLVAWNYLFTLITVRQFSHYASVFFLRTCIIGVVTVWNFMLYRFIFQTGQVTKACNEFSPTDQNFPQK